MVETNLSRSVAGDAANQETQILAIGLAQMEQFASLDADQFSVTLTEDLEAAMTHLRRNACDIIFLDDKILGDETGEIVRELKRRYPLMPLCIVSSYDDDVYLAELIGEGIDDLIAHDLTVPHLLRRLNLLMRLRRRHKAQARRNASLHAVTMHAQQLHQAETPTELIQDMVEMACNRFGHYGVAIAIEEGSHQHLYAGTVETERNLFESIITATPTSPIGQVMQSNSLRIFNDLNGLRENEMYFPVSVLTSAQSAIMLPLKYGNQVLGVLSIFNTEPDSFSFDDLAPYELLASHFSSAYYNAHHYQVAFDNVRASRYSLRAWQRLTRLYTMNEVTDTLCELLQGMPGVSQVVTWVDSILSQNNKIYMSGSSEAVIAALDAMNRRGELQHIIDDRFDDQMRPQIYWQKNSVHTPLRAMFDPMQGQQILFAPLVGSMQTMLGGVFISSSSSQEFTAQDRSLVESLTHAAAQTVERNTVLDEMQTQKSELQEQKGRLEAVLTSIREGIISVDDSGMVVIANPQFTEVTGVSRSQVRRKDQATVLQALANQTNNPEAALKELNSAIEQVLSSEHSGENYPIVELTLAEDDSIISIEFAHIKSNERSQGWVGFVRDTSQRHTMTQDNTNQEMLTSLIEDIGIPYTKLHQEVITLRKHHGDVSYRKREQMLQDLENGVDAAERMWTNFSQLYNVEMSGIALEPVEVDPSDVVDDLLRSRRMSKYYGLIDVNRQPPRVTVNVDERYIKQALTNLIEYMMSVSGGNTRVTIHIKPEADSVLIMLQDKGPGLTEQQVSTLFEPATAGGFSDGNFDQLGVFLAQKLITKHNGSLTVESNPGMGIIFEVSLPTMENNYVPAEPGRIAAPARNANKQLSIMIVEGNKRHLASAHPIIQRQRHELFVERSVRNALRNLTLTHLHVVLVETDAVDMEVMALCQEIRKQSEVPIIVVSDKNREEERIEALELGADYIALPMSEKEFLARLQKAAQRTQTGGAPEPPLEMGDLYLNFSQRRVYLGGQVIDLTAKEYELLRVLAMNKEQVLTHQQLLGKVWGPEYRDATQYLWVNVSRLRKKLEPDDDSPRYIHTEPGTGYVFREP